jgi:hypothetical protein
MIYFLEEIIVDKRIVDKRIVEKRIVEKRIIVKKNSIFLISREKNCYLF